MNVVKIIETTIEQGRRIVKALRNGRDDVQTSKQITPFGFESNPVRDSIGLYTQTSTKNRTYIIGYIAEGAITEVGESRVFSTDAQGVVQIDFIFKANGTVEMGGSADNAVRYSALETAFNELKSKFNSLVTAYNAHVHTGVTTGPGVSGTTPSVGSPSTADITGAKINELKTS